MPIFLDLSGVSDYCKNAVCEPTGRSIPRPRSGGSRSLRDFITADRVEFNYQETTNAAFQEKNAHRACQDLWLSGENRFDGSVERAERLEFSS